MKISPLRKGCPVFKPFDESIAAPYEPWVAPARLIYYQSKMTHSGISTWKTFENCYRKPNVNSLSNLLNQLQKDYDGQEASPKERTTRSLNKIQSRKVKALANKLCYYSRIRTFTSRKTGSYKFKVGFLTLTAPESATDTQMLKAFESFLDYLRRTANCVFVWKKELGEKGNRLHFHVMINNFIPYYLVSWKWKRLLLAQGVKWPTDEKGVDFNSHTRIELPRSRKLVAHYISKYMSKAHALPRELGYVAGHSKILEELEEPKYIQGDLPQEEILDLYQYGRTIRDLFLTHCCIDLRRVQSVAPTLYYYFMKQFERFQAQISLPQKYWYV